MEEQIQRIKIKQALFKEQKRLFEERVTNQEEFNLYISSLREDEPCAFMTGIKEIVSLCNKPEFECRFRGQEYYSLGQNPKKECMRAKMLRYERILGKKH